MHIVIAFINIGPYHLARLKGAEIELTKENHKLSAIQLTDDSLEHPWGEINNYLNCKIHTLIPVLKGTDKNSKKNLPIVEQKKVNKLLERLSPDLIFIPGWAFDLSKKIKNWAKVNNIKLALMSESKENDKKRFIISELYKKYFVLPSYSAAIVGGEIHAKYLQQLGMLKNKIFFGYDIVDNEFFRLEANKSRSNRLSVLKGFKNLPDEPFFMSAFRLIKRKNAKNMLIAYKEYLNSIGNSSWNLVICGNGEQFNELNELCLELEIINKVKFLGFLDYYQLATLYGLASCFIHPAFSEQWGLVINEACASGIPILSSKTVAASSELVKDKYNGYLFDPYNIKSISNSMIKITNLTKAERECMGENSQILVSNFNYETFGKSILEIISLVNT